MALTIGGLVLEARGVLNDTAADADDADAPGNGSTRYSDADLYQYFNDALLLARGKRPDLFLDMGLRNAVPQYATTDSAVAFPLDPMYYPPFVSYVVGMAELREDTFSDDNRAVTMLNKFVTGLLQVAS